MTATATIAAPASPYKGLSPFEDSPLDALLFFGRSRETEIVAANVLASRLTVLYGPSGVGKSSLLRAGVVRSLRGAAEPAPAVVVYGAWAGDALSGLEEATRAAVEDAIGREPADAPGGLADRLAALTAELGSELCLLLDQLEELFLYHRAESGAGGFVDLLPELVTRPGLRVNVLLGIRDDALAQLDVFKQRLPGLFANSLRLDHLDAEAARAAVLGPLDRYNELVGAAALVAIEPALVDAVLDEVETGRIEKGFGGRGSSEAAALSAGRIETPYLQLVMQRIWEVERERGSSVLRFATLRELGGAERIVESHLERALAALTPAQQDAAADVFGHLVTPSGTKVAHGVTDLASYAAIDEPQLEPVLRSLAHERILRPLGENGHAAGDRYEIFHDVLAEAVLAWRTRHDADAALARERETARRRHRTLLALTAAALVALAAMTALTVYAFTQRSEANEQAALATAAADLAADNQARAEQLREVAEDSERNADTQAVKAEDAEANALAAAEFAEREEARADAQAQLAREAQSRAEDEALRAKSNETLATQSAAEEQAARRQAESAADDAERARRRAQEQAEIAKVERNRALNARRRARARELAQEAFAVLTIDPERSLSLAWEAATLFGDVLIEDSLRQALTASRIRLILPANARVRAAHFSPDGTRVVTASDDGAARLYDVRGDRRRLLGTLRHNASVVDAEFDPTGALIVSASRDGRAAIWSAQTGMRESTLRHEGPVSSASFSSDGQFVVTAGMDGTLRVWRRNGDHVRTVPVDGSALSAFFSPNGKMVAAVLLARDGRRTARVFDAGSGDALFTPDQRGIQSVTFSPDNALLATTSSDRTTKLWSTRSGDRIHEFPQTEGWVVDAEFSPDGRLIASASQGSTVGLWDVASGNRVHLLCCADNFAQSASFSPDGRFVVVASVDRTARVFEVSTGRQTMLLAGHDDSVLTAEFSANGQRVVTAGADGTARVWDPGTADQLGLLGRHSGPVRAASFSPDGTLVISAGDDGAARLWRARGGSELRSFRHGRPVTTAVFSGNGRFVATASPQEGTTRVWDAASGAEQYRLRGSRPERALFSPDSRNLLTTEAAGSARVWRAVDGTGLATLENDRRLTAAAFSPNGQSIAAGRGNGSAGIWETRTGALLHELEGHTAAVVAVSYSRSGQRIVTAGQDATARVWDARSGRLVHTLVGHSAPVTDAEFDLTGRYIVTGSVDNDARFWDAETGKTIRTLRAHFGTVVAVSFSADARWIVTAGPTTAGLWRTRTGRFLGFLRGPTSTVTTASFAPRGHRIVAASVDRSVRVYRCEICGGRDELRALARVRLNRARGR